MHGASLHDAGRIVHPDEMHGGGCARELAGRDLLEEQAVRALADAAGLNYWDVFDDAMGVFDAVAAGADERLLRSMQAG